MTNDREKLAAVLRHLKIESADLLGRGMTSSLYDIGGGRVLKIHNGPQEQGYLPRLKRFSEQLQTRSFPFAVPLIYEYGAVGEVHFHVERRLPGTGFCAGLSSPDNPRKAQRVLLHFGCASPFTFGPMAAATLW